MKYRVTVVYKGLIIEKSRFGIFWKTAIFNHKKPYGAYVCKDLDEAKVYIDRLIQCGNVVYRTIKGIDK